MSGGLGARLFVAGDVITAADVNGYLMNQAMMRFPTTAARDTAFGNGIPVGQTEGGIAGDGKPLLQEGMFAYIDSNNDVQFFNGSQWTSAPQFVLGDGEVTTAKLADDAVTGAKIADDSITSAHIAPGTVIASDIADGSITSAKILDGTIVNADVNASADIAHSKLANATAGQVLLGTTTTGVVTATTITGDVTVTGAGVTAISSGVILNADVNASADIADTKLATIATALKVSNSATTAASANTASAIVARDASGNFVAGKATLATADVTTVLETALIVPSAAGGTINIDFNTNPTVYYTSNSSANCTLNIRGTSSVTLNSVLATGQIATVTFLETCGAVPYYPTVYQIDGVSVTPKFMGGTAPSSGNANSIDAYTIAIIKTGNAAFTVLASQTRFA